MSDASVIYEDGVLVRTIAANATATPAPTAAPSATPSPTPGASTMTLTPAPTPTTTPGSLATPTAGNGLDVGLVILMFAIIAIAAAGAYYLLRKK